MDRRDWTLAQSIFFPDAVVHHGAAASPAALVARLAAAHASVPMSSHIIGGIRIEFVGDQALAESYVLAMQRIPGGQSGQQYAVMTGRYVDRFEQRSGVWKIASRTTVVDGTMIVPAPLSPGPPDASWAVGVRDPSDPAVAQREALASGREVSQPNREPK
jgi:hypothetical protein